MSANILPALMNGGIFAAGWKRAKLSRFGSAKTHSGRSSCVEAEEVLTAVHPRLF
jgi:hypothetical protein